MRYNLNENKRTMELPIDRRVQGKSDADDSVPTRQKEQLARTSGSKMYAAATAIVSPQVSMLDLSHDDGFGSVESNKRSRPITSMSFGYYYESHAWQSSNEPHAWQSSHKHQLSYTSPVSHANYASLGESPAVSFLSQFALPEEQPQRLKISDGEVLDGKYLVGKVLGRGNFAECREAHLLKEFSESSGGKVALKIVRRSECDDLQEFENFDREMELWCKLNHPNILPLLDVIEADDAIIAVSPIAEKGNLYDIITKQGPFSEEEARVIFRRIESAISYLHNVHEVVHKDIKLENILMDCDNHVYVCDFGLSMCLRDEDALARYHSCSTDTIFCQGSLWYMAPEQISDTVGRDGEVKADPKKADSWAMGVVLYAMLTGKLPFQDDYFPRLQRSIENGEYEPLLESFCPELRHLVENLLCTDWQKRFSLEQILQHPWLCFDNG